MSTQHPSARATRIVFDRVPKTYHQVRPTYPKELFRELRKQLPEDTTHAHLLEIGAGTGIATTPLAKAGFHITAIELGEQLSIHARENLAQYPNVEVVSADFETWDAPRDIRYDCIYSATAWWWIDPKIGTPKAASLLTKGGLIAIFAYHHIAGGTTAFFQKSQDSFAQVDPSTPADWQLPVQTDLTPTCASLCDEGWFYQPTIHRYPFLVHYTAQEYITLLSTYSTVLSLSEEQRSTLLDGIFHLIQQDFNGTIAKQYEATLVLAYPMNNPGAFTLTD